GVSLRLPEFLRDPFSAAMSQSVLLPAFVGLLGIVAALFLVGFTPWATSDSVPDGDDDYDDDDAYVEFILVREPPPPPPPARARVVRPRPAPARREEPVRPRRGPLDRPVPQARPIGFAHNGSHVGSHTDTGRRSRPITEVSPRAFRPSSSRDRPSDRHLNGSARRHLAEGEAPRGQHHRRDPDDGPTSYGRHSSGR
ncbi:MAG: MFS transporter, partial [Mycobacterium sp.]